MSVRIAKKFKPLTFRFQEASSAGLKSSMAGVAQLVEPRIVIPVVAGSNPVARPSLGPLAQLVEQETLNLLVQGSNP